MKTQRKVPAALPSKSALKSKKQPAVPAKRKARNNTTDPIADDQKIEATLNLHGSDDWRSALKMADPLRAGQPLNMLDPEWERQRAAQSIQQDLPSIAKADAKVKSKTAKAKPRKTSTENKGIKARQPKGKRANPKREASLDGGAWEDRGNPIYAAVKDKR